LWTKHAAWGKLFGESAELLNVEAIGAFGNHLALSIKNVDVYEMVLDCKNVVLVEFTHQQMHFY
jgi:hypothetical protein